MSKDKWNAPSRVHQTPVSRLEIDDLKEQRRKLVAQSHLLPKGPDGARVRNAREIDVEVQIHTQEKRLGRKKGIAKSEFNPPREKPLRTSFRGHER